MASREPSRDQFTKSYLDAFSERLDTPPARLELMLVARFTAPKTVGVESSNASARRHVVASSTQCNAPKLEVVSAEFVLAKLRSRDWSAHASRGHPLHCRRLRKSKRYRQVRARAVLLRVLVGEDAVALVGLSSASGAEASQKLRSVPWQKHIEAWPPRKSPSSDKQGRSQPGRIRQGACLRCGG